jgi:hypothetical protein
MFAAQKWTALPELRISSAGQLSFAAEVSNVEFTRLGDFGEGVGVVFRHGPERLSAHPELLE